MPWKDPEVRRQKRREWYASTADSRREYFRDYSQRLRTDMQIPDHRFRSVKTLYNLGAEEYLQLILDQNNVCAICGKSETNRSRNGDIRPLNVDHCHKTGKVRALLCTHCNTMLGSARDNVETLQKGIEYLNQHEEN